MYDQGVGIVYCKNQEWIFVSFKRSYHYNVKHFNYDIITLTQLQSVLLILSICSKSLIHIIIQMNSKQAWLLHKDLWIQCFLTVDT